jgi:uncharacterized membrane protein (DUF373 family)
MTHVIGIKSQDERFITADEGVAVMRDLKDHDFLGLFKKIVIYIVMVMIALLIVAIVYTMGEVMWDFMTDVNGILASREEILGFIGFFLLAVIALEIMDILYLYTKTNTIHVEVVVLIAMTSVSRELIVFDYENNDGVLIAGIGVLIASLSVGYYFIKKVHHDYGVSENNAP